MKKCFAKVLAVTAVFAIIFNIVGLSIGFVFAESGSKTKTWSFNSADDMKDFKTYYWNSAGGYVKEQDYTDSFTLSNGELSTKRGTVWNSRVSEGKFDNITAITLNDPTMRNIEVTYKIKKNEDYGYSKSILFGFREKTPGQIVNGKEWDSGVQLDGTKIVAYRTAKDNGSPAIAMPNNTEYTNGLIDGYNTYKLRLVGDKLNVWINGVKTVTDHNVSGANQCGYTSIYFANSTGAIDEISVTRLDKDGKEINLVPEVNFASSPIVVAKGTTLESVKALLPAQANAVYEGYEVPVDIDDWKAKNYNPDVEGNYKFTANIVGLANYFSSFSVETTVKVSNDVAKFSMTDAKQIKKYFDSRFSSNILQFGAGSTKIADYWNVTNNGITRIASENANQASDASNMAILTYKEKKLTSFVLNITFKQGADSTSKSPILGFGADKVGKFATADKGGIAAYVSADGKLNLWSNMFSTSGDYRLSYDIGGYDSTVEHQLKLVVGLTKVNFYLDGTLIASYRLKSYNGGYVYLACGSNCGTFKNFELSPLAGINSVADVDSISVPLNTTLEAVKAKLPKKIKTTLDNGSKATYEILDWSSETYNPVYAGKYKFYGTLKADSSVNPASLDAATIVEVSEVYDSDITKKYFFDSVDDLDDFTSYHAKEANPDIKGSGFSKVDWRKNWSLTDGMLKKNNSSANSDTENVSMLVLNKQKYKNFELTVDFVQGKESYRWAMVGIGAEKMGEFALSDKGGRVYYLQQEGYLSSWSNEFVTGWEYHETYATYENYERNAIHRMKITVLGGKVTIQVDDYAPYVVTDLPEDYKGGYIYLAGNGNSAMFDNLTIVDYDIKNRKITNIPASKKIVYDHNDKFAEYTLPETVNVIADDGRAYPMSVKWTCSNFRSNIPGVYKHIGKVILPSAKFKNPKNLTGSLDLQVIVDYDPKTSIKYYFDTEAELDDFVTYYTKTTGNDGLKKVPTSEQWKINEEGRIARIDQNFEQLQWSEEFAATKLSTLVWNVKELKNFEIEVDYKQGANTWLWAMVMFGIKDPTQWIMNYTGTDSGDLTGVGGYAAYAQQEGTATVWGDLAYGYREMANLPGVVNYNRSAVNHMKINVVNGIVKVYINESTEPLTVDTRTHDTTGKIALACGMNLAEYDNLKITSLDSKGNPVNAGLSGVVNTGPSQGGSYNGNGSSSPQTGDESYKVIVKVALVMVATAVFVLGFLGGRTLRVKNAKID